MKNQIKASAEIGVRETSKFSASAKINKGALDGIGHSRDLFGANKDKSTKSDFSVNKLTGNPTYSIDDSVITTQIIPGIDLEVDAVLAAQMGMKLTVSHELSVADFMALKNEGELFVGATAKFNSLVQ